MKDNWIYIGADINCMGWSKVGKTTVGLHTRHTSSQRPGYFIYAAYEIKVGDISEIESSLLHYLRLNYPNERHFSTGSKSECFGVNPYHMAEIVQGFLEVNYPSSIAYDHIFRNLVRNYQCNNNVYSKFRNELNPIVSNFEGHSWLSPSIMPSDLAMTKNDYYSGNQIKHEEDLGDGYFFDFDTGMQGYRYEDGTIEWKYPD